MATTPLNSTNVVVDDTDPALIYNGAWVKGGSASEFNVTTHGSTQKGDSVRFTFRGTSVVVYGTIGTDTPSSAYILDGGASSIFTAGKQKTFVYQQQFFHSPTLTDGEHTLLITNLGSGELWIDYITYTQSHPASSSTSSSRPPSTTLSLQPTLTSRTLTTSQTLNINTLTPNSSPTSSEATSSAVAPPQVNSNAKSSIPASAVAGGAIGALVLIILLIFGLLYYRRRAKRLAGEKLLEKRNVLDPPQSDKVDPGVPITPFTSTYNSSPHTSFGHGSSNMNIFPPGPAYPTSEHGYRNQSPPSTPIYHFSHHYSLQPGYSSSSENIAGVGAGPGYEEVNPGGSQGGTQYGYANSLGQSDYLRNPRSPQSGIEQYPYTSTDRLAVPERRNSLESAESHASLAYLSGDRVAMNPSSPLPEVLPGPPFIPTTFQQSGKGGLIVHNPEIRQHEDGGVRLDVEQPHPSGSQQQVVDVPPVYKPNY